MKYEISLKDSAKKTLDNLTKKDRERIYKSFLAISHYPVYGNRLDLPVGDYYSIDIWPFMIIYKIFDKLKLVSIVKINYSLGVNKH
ncbi:hypothetical protein A2767_03815 [Candidatus Roizmanbacteria bacterium RIFCSPHIGHO2_01_FULL_35_10]|uniref:Addiction module toxin RelE n=1 Tax=Candidatus Roizmanbacteria bacterium RIFCSPLOWO2_01_FULL_35_13 TaxID=1802055 RepID=A0A1F7IA67_9BACT|nr:MAG: hypothetical protein A2767_03815 [Candidatus Roizmanbacteria bacterium RIFCSPHIGHO2_01_FULL_35_10]OGK40251.1 MAG: hypothetical protein A3A74_07130 [Candidatus Roizmanbacteria bacterium RIFCSPLOWO2_01_FULL_35_13]